MKKLIVCLLILATYSCSNYGEKLEFNGTEVYYTDLVTLAQATQLGNYLNNEGFTDGTKKSVQLTRDDKTNNLVFKMVSDPKVINDASNDFVFTSFATNLNTEFNEDLDFHVTDNTFKTMKVYLAKDLSKSIMAKQTQVLYTKHIKQEEAQKLSEFLIESKFANDESPKTVQLDKKNNVYLFRMVVKKGFEKSDANANILKFFGSQLSVNVFNNDSLRVQMCNDKLETIRDIN